MGLIAKDSGGTREPAPAGTHAAWCFGLIDLGTQVGDFNGERKVAHKAWLWWELADEKQADGKPFRIGGFYAVSLHEKSNLRKMLQSWRGRPFTPEELGAFDLRNVVGKPCLLTVTHEAGTDGKVRDKISAVTTLVKGMKPAPMTNPITVFDIDDWDAKVFESLPDFLKAMVAKSPEGRGKLGLGAAAPDPARGHADAPAYDGPGDDEIPY